MPVSICSQAVSLLTAVHSQPGGARAKTIIIPMIYLCLAATADIHTAHWDSTATHSILQRPTFETMEDCAIVHARSCLTFGRQWLLSTST